MSPGPSTEIQQMQAEVPPNRKIKLRRGSTFLEMRYTFYGFMAGSFIVATIFITAGLYLAFRQVYWFGFPFVFFGVLPLYSAVSVLRSKRHIFVLDLATQILYNGDKHISFTQVQALQVIHQVHTTRCSSKSGTTVYHDDVYALILQYRPTTLVELSMKSLGPSNTSTTTNAIQEIYPPLIDSNSGSHTTSGDPTQSSPQLRVLRAEEGYTAIMRIHTSKLEPWQQLGTFLQRTFSRLCQRDIPFDPTPQDYQLEEQCRFYVSGMSHSFLGFT